MPSSKFTVRTDTATKKRLEKVAKSSGRSRSFLATEAMNEYLAVSDWQIAGTREAVDSADRGEFVPHDQVKAWVNSWDTDNELPIPTARRHP
jgi:RHH-type rel operon transcriptional repressor/antitoxin RelB